MKKLLFVIDDITKRGGTERITVTLAQHLIKDNIPCEIFSLKKGNDLPFYNTNGIPIIFGGNGSFSTKYSAIRYARLNDLTVIVVSMGRLSFEMVLLAKLVGFSNIYCYEHVAFESLSKKIQFLKLFAYRLAKGVICLTKNDTDVILKKIPTINICSIDNITPYEDFGAMPVLERENVVLAVGRLTYQKNFEKLIRLWSRVDAPDWTLKIIGDGEEKNNLQDLVGELQLSNVDICPATNEIEKFYLSSKIYAMTSRYEGLPMVLIEALGFGLPIVSFDCKTGPGEIIKDNVSGYLIENHNDDLFIEKLQQLIKEPAMRCKMSEAAKNSATRFTYQQVKYQWMHFLGL
ncbi:glycosyltransferase family 4 protein [Pluralibacter gergoviae]|uniref:glycosyltransferase family 4 protein n=1 Tax=Pluralibacter gergoviae TaxID=61647 RepID=UPI003312B79C|nr:glycosyltransferase family 4 protein [Pluralibacter gergoviae]